MCENNIHCSQWSVLVPIFHTTRLLNYPFEDIRLQRLRIYCVFKGYRWAINFVAINSKSCVTYTIFDKNILSFTVHCIAVGNIFVKLIWLAKKPFCSTYYKTKQFGFLEFFLKFDPWFCPISDFNGFCYFSCNRKQKHYPDQTSKPCYLIYTTLKSCKFFIQNNSFVHQMGETLAFFDSQN